MPAPTDGVIHAPQGMPQTLPHEDADAKPTAQLGQGMRLRLRRMDGAGRVTYIPVMSILEAKKLWKILDHATALGHADFKSIELERKDRRSSEWHEWLSPSGQKLSDITLSQSATPQMNHEQQRA